MKTGDVQTTGYTGTPVLRIPGHATPCGTCPKGGPQNEHLFTLTPANERVVRIWWQSRATGGRRSPTR